jgi:uncharacterized SAM-binding protein YcdF (DUF218 family)
MKKSIVILAIIFALGIFIAFSFYEFSLGFYDDYSVQKSDAVVVLTGGRGRLSPALKLFTETDSKWFLIAGVGEKISLNSIFSSNELNNVDPEKIILEKYSRSTYQNAIHARDILLEKGVRSVILVTSTYHIKRALLIFRSIFPENVYIIPYAVESDNFLSENWWKTAKGLKLAILEYLKYQWYRWTL